jgi:DNA-binding NarL/FixJ family response regulator
MVVAATNLNPVRILIAAGHEFFRLGLKSVLAENHPNDWQIVAQASNGLDALGMGESLRPDVAILDLSTPGRSGLEVTERRVECISGIRILILIMYASALILHRVRKAGASACVTKNESPPKLVSAVERALAGERFGRREVLGD